MTLLKRHRLAQGWTQAQLGAKVGRTAGSVCAWESGKSLPDAQVFPKLARALGLNPIDLTKVVSPPSIHMAAV